MSVSVSRQRVLSLWLARLPTDRLARSHRSTTPVVIYGKRGNAELIVALDECAEKRGLHSGLTLAQARAMYPNLAAIEEDAGADAKLLDSIADWSLRYTPLVACDPPNGLLLDITGCAHLYGGEDRLVSDLSKRLVQAGLVHEIAVAGTIGAAWAAARFGKPGYHANGRELSLLAPLPLTALRLDGKTVASLGRVGLKRIGDIVGLPRAPLAARFGAELLRQFDRALGRELEPLAPRLPVAPYSVEQRFAEPILLEADVLTGIERLAARLKSTLERQGDGARQLELTLFRTDGAIRRISTGTSRPLRDPAEIRALFVERLAALADEFDPGFGFDMTRLAAVVAEPWHDEQSSLAVGASGHDDDEALARLADRLSARLGTQRVRRLVAQDSHIPERAVTALPAQTVHNDVSWNVFRRHRAEHDLGPRPLRMLMRPEPIEAMAEVPDGPPLRFRWRRALHEVAAAEGPERIEGTWWTATGAADSARDYFRVEDKTGLRFWLFRAGLYRNLTEDDWKERRFPKWYMHGTFM
jgi:protein ImuB